MGYLLQSTLLASDLAADDLFGQALALSANGLVMAVGAPLWEGSPANQGKVYVYERASVGDNWTPRATVTASDPASMDFYGAAVALSADGVVLAVGAEEWEGSPSNRGGVYIYDWSGSAYAQRGSVLTASDGAADDLFGTGLALASAGTVLAVGARTWEGSVSNQGGVYIYDWSGSAWVQRGSVLVAADASGSYADFGASLALSEDGNVLAVGAPLRSNDWDIRGGVYVYDRDGSAWTQRGGVLGATALVDGELEVRFGTALALSEDASVLLVSMSNIPGLLNYVVRRYTPSGSAWVESVNDLQASSGIDDAAGFGQALAVNTDATVVVVGSRGDDAHTDNQGAVHTFTYTAAASGSGAALYRPVATGWGPFTPNPFGAGAAVYQPAAGGAGTCFESARYPVTVTVSDPAEDIVCPIRIQAVAAEDLQLPVRITVIDPAAVGGLDGAGGWPAAPDGRWMAVVFLDGADISSRLEGVVTVRCADDEARTAEFRFQPASPIAPMGLIGRPVRIAFAQRGAAEAVINAQTLFTGLVEQPSVDATTGAVSCLCTDQFQEIMANTAREWIDANVGGRWSTAVSGEPADTWDYAQARLASVPCSLALDEFQRPRVLPWHSPSRSVTLREADVWEETLAVDLPRRSELRTRIVLTAQYRYEALRNRGFVSRFQFPQGWFMFGVNGVDGPLQWLTTSMIEQACDGLPGWRLGRLVIDHPVPGIYPKSSDPNDGAYVVLPETVPDLAVGWTAYFAHRWRQTRTETWKLTVAAPNLEALLGAPVAEEMGISLEAPDPDPAWESDEEVGPRFGAVAPIVEPIPAALVGDTAAAYPEVEDVDADGYTRADFDHAIRTALDQAWVRLDGGARSGRVRWGMPCRPDLWLDTLVTFEGTHVRAAGKIAEITHTLDAETGEADSEIAFAVGLPGATPAGLPAWTLPDVPDPDAEAAAAPVDLTKLSGRHGYHVGGLASSPEWDEDNMVGFSTNTAMFLSDAVKAARNWYPHQLSIKAPDIDAEDRDPLDIPVAATVSANVNTDLLEIL